MKTKVRKIKTSQGLRDFTYLGCPLTNNRVAWCFRLCTPDKDGVGHCGRVAPHGFKSVIQEGIEKQQRMSMKAHLEKLERMYLGQVDDEDFEPGLHLAEGMVELVVPVKKSLLNAAGTVSDSMYYTLLRDAAGLAAQTLSERCFVQLVNFNMYVINPVSDGELIGLGRFIQLSGGQFMMEAVLTDQEGTEIARGSGSFKKIKTRLTAERGYV